MQGQSIYEFIATFDDKYRKIEKKNMILPPEILPFKLLRKANITKEEKLLVLTGMNYENKITLYEEAKKSLKKFKGDSDSSSSNSIRLEPAYLAQNEEALLAAGYIKAKNRGKNASGIKDTTWKHGKPVGGYSNDGRLKRGEFASSVRKPNTQKSLNPTGSDGHLLRCTSCGSFRHLLPACPDSWENVAKVNVTEQEHAILFTGYNTEQVGNLGVDAQNCAVLDSACSSNVCGDNWIYNYIQSLDQGNKQKVRQFKSKRVFKFGGGTCLYSNR